MWLSIRSWSSEKDRYRDLCESSGYYLLMNFPGTRPVLVHQWYRREEGVEMGSQWPFSNRVVHLN